MVELRSRICRPGTRRCTMSPNPEAQHCVELPMSRVHRKFFAVVRIRAISLFSVFVARCQSTSPFSGQERREPHLDFHPYSIASPRQSKQSRQKPAGMREVRRLTPSATRVCLESQGRHGCYPVIEQVRSQLVICLNVSYRMIQ